MTDECKPLSRTGIGKVHIEASPCVTQAADLHRRETVPLSEALETLSRTGRQTPCQREPGLFLSDDHTERSQAAQACQMCPIFDPCAVHADTFPEVFHVWAGVDRSALSRKTKP